MSILARHLDDYLRLRRMLGHKLDDAARQLPWFVEYLDATDNEYVTVQAALAWALDRDWPAGSTVPGHRMTAVRGFARYLAGSTRAPRSRCRASSASRARGDRRSSTQTTTCWR